MAQHPDKLLSSLTSLLTSGSASWQVFWQVAQQPDKWLRSITSFLTSGSAAWQVSWQAAQQHENSHNKWLSTVLSTKYCVDFGIYCHFGGTNFYRRGSELTGFGGRWKIDIFSCVCEWVTAESVKGLDPWTAEVKYGLLVIIVGFSLRFYWTFGIYLWVKWLYLTFCLLLLSFNWLYLCFE